MWRCGAEALWRMAVTYNAVSLSLWLWCCGRVALGVSWHLLAVLAFSGVLDVLGEDVQKKRKPWHVAVALSRLL